MSLTSSKISDIDHKPTLLDDTRLINVHEAFLSGHLNDNTRAAYSNGIEAFFRYLARSGVTDILDAEPRDVSRFLREKSDDGLETATVRLYLSAVKTFLDACVIDGLLSVNPATSVKAPRASSYRGKTPVVVPTQVRQIFDAIPHHGSGASPADYRDRALIALMTFSFFRVSAALGLNLRDYDLRGDERWLIGAEKGGKRHEMPVHPTLETMLDALIEVMALNTPDADLDTPLFQSSTPRGGKLTGRRLDRTAAWRMVRRRARAAGVTREICNHTFRATGITAYLEAGGNLEDARIMANHSSATTTKLYDRTSDRVKAQEIGRLDI